MSMHSFMFRWKAHATAEHRAAAARDIRARRAAVPGVLTLAVELDLPAA